MKKTDYRFKLLYAIGIVTVVSGHVVGGGISFFYDWFPPYAFHMPLFAFCSGYFYKENSTDEIIKFVLSKFKRLIIPLYLWNFFYGALIFFLKPYGLNYGSELTWHNLFIELLYGGHQFTYNMGGWFVVSLFLIQIFNVVFRKILKCLKIKANEYIILVFYFALGLLGVYLSMKGINKGNWLVLNKFVFLLPFYECGTLFKKNLEYMEDKIGSIAYFGFVFLAQMIILIMNGKAYTYTLSWCIFSGSNIALPYIQSLVIIAFWLRVSKILVPSFTNNKYINLISDNAYSIMINQFLGFFIIKSLFGIVAKYTKYCGNFDFTEFKSNIWYYYFPKNDNHWSIVYCIAGIVVPILIQNFISFIKHKLKRDS